MTNFAALPYSLTYDNRGNRGRQMTDLAGITLIGLGLGLVATQRGLSSLSLAEEREEGDRYRVAHKLQEDEALRQLIQHKQAIEAALQDNQAQSLQQALAALEELQAVQFSSALSPTAELQSSLAQSQIAVARLDAAIAQRSREVVSLTVEGVEDPAAVAQQALAVLRLSERIDQRRHVSESQSSLDKINDRQGTADLSASPGRLPDGAALQNCLTPSSQSACDLIAWSQR